MQLSSNTILITGGATGIGLALGKRLLAAGNRIIVCGRRAQPLAALRAKHPPVETRTADVSKAAERELLIDWATRSFPDLNVLVNNAGIQRRVQLKKDRDWQAMHEEIAINLDAPLHLTSLLLPHLLKQKRAAIVNVTSGLSFVPLAATPVYCATKAALHSFTLSLRHQLVGTPVEVVEIIPPAVNTDLGGAGLHTFGVAVDEFADAAMSQLEAGANEVAHGFAQQASRASREQLDAIFKRMNSEE
jgi:uncharacterized oxidoreductase